MSPPGALASQEDLPRLAIVVDARSGVVRAVSHGVTMPNLSALVERAATDPVGEDLRPALPRSLECAPERVAALQPAASAFGCSVTATRSLPAADRALNGLFTYLSSVSSTLPSTNLPWAELTREAIALEPWSATPDSVRFHLQSDDPQVDGLVVVLLGMAGEQIGFSVFPSKEAHDTFLDVTGMLTSEAPASFACRVVQLDRTDEDDPIVVAQATAAGLVFGALNLSLVDYHEGRPRRMTAEAELATFRAVEAVLATWERHHKVIYRHPARQRVAVYRGGQVTLNTVPPHMSFTAPERPPPVGVLDDRPRAFGWFPVGVFDDPLPTVFFKYAKADALRASKAIQGLDAIEVDTDPYGNLLINGWAGRQSLGLIAALDAALVDLWVLRTSPVVRVCVAKGGARRHTVRANDVVSSFATRVRGAQAPTVQLNDPAWDDPDPRGMLRAAHWRGDPTQWPKASALLHSFVAPLRPEHRPPSDHEGLFRASNRVWNAVVAADHRGDHSHCAALLQHAPAVLGGTEGVKKLIARKRACCPLDSRIFVVDEVGVQHGELMLQMMWMPGTLPARR